ncbi:glycoside hydrolase family 108 protein [Sphingosinicella sp.]|uniref:glycoside hydrolase family 108 protein n=1 Tax=Sphingosinicella sp. TaxID=1917971 RepID=UPI004037D249
MDIDSMIEELIDREGDYVNHPADRGGPTRWGITEAVARAHGYRGDMRALPRAEAASVYRRIYWLRPGFDRVAERAPKVAAESFDTAVNMGPETAVGFLQRALNALNRNGRDYADIMVDRRIGPATLGALGGFLAARGAAGEAVLVRALDALQGERYVGLAEARPANEAFLYGWLANRLG